MKIVSGRTFKNPCSRARIRIKNSDERICVHICRKQHTQGNDQARHESKCISLEFFHHWKKIIISLQIRVHEANEKNLFFRQTIADNADYVN